MHKQYNIKIEKTSQYIFIMKIKQENTYKVYNAFCGATQKKSGYFCTIPYNCAVCKYKLFNTWLREENV